MAQTREQIIERHQQLRAEYAGLFDQLQALLFQHDPVGINFETNSDEYDPEVGTILPRLRGCGSVEEVCLVVHEEFVRWFGADTAGGRERYSKIGAEIWQLWQLFQGAEHRTAPNGGPAMPPEASGATKGPPSVS